VNSLTQLPVNANSRPSGKTRRKYEGELKKINLFFTSLKGVVDLYKFFVHQ
tara:strand:+ start:2054 stop:2206 length:153 start_codon:yes stop_codon:yes gene_type:complete